MNVVKAGGRQRAEEQIGGGLRLLAAGQAWTNRVGQCFEKTVRPPTKERRPCNSLVRRPRIVHIDTQAL